MNNQKINSKKDWVVNMKHIQKIRLSVQLLCVALTIIGFFTSFKIVSGLIFIFSVFGGVIFCGWVCPFGTLQEIFSKLGTLLGIKKVKMANVLQKIMFFSRYILFAVAMLITADIIFTLLSFDPRGNMLMLLSSQNVGIIAVVVIAVFAILSMFYERFFCNYLCVEGAKYGLVSVLRPLTIIRNKDKCVNCNKCTKACPMNIDIAKSNQMHSPQCINCMKCISECPVKDTLKYGVRTFDKKQIIKYTAIIILLISSAIVVFATGVMNDDHEPTSRGNRNNEEVTITENNNSQTNEVQVIGEKVNDYIDGTYTGTGLGFKGPMDVEVIINNGFITQVEVIKHNDDRKWFNRANNQIPDKIIESQSTNVDVVGGATYSSKGIIEGVTEALIKAK